MSFIPFVHTHIASYNANSMNFCALCYTHTTQVCICNRCHGLCGEFIFNFILKRKKNEKIKGKNSQSVSNDHHSTHLLCTSSALQRCPFGNLYSFRMLKNNMRKFLIQSIVSHFGESDFGHYTY